jgi:hypothetical protein
MFTSTFKPGLVALLALVAIGPLAAQNRTRFGGRYEAIDYAYGNTVGGAQPAALSILTGNSATGSQTAIVAFGYTTAGDGRVFTPLATNAPILVGGGSNQETVTPSAVSCSTPTAYGTCTFTATFVNVHGTGDSIVSASFGLQEAINLAQSDGGGSVIVDQAWSKRGGLTSTITSASPYSNVTVEDMRSGDQYWSMQPTTVTVLAVPTTLTSGTAVFSGTSGTWTNAAQFTCVTYVDALGGEGPCSATFNQTPSANTSLTITSPAASAGAVGWRAYAGASYNAAYLLPVTTSACTLSTLESVMPACAIGANGTWPAIFLTTTTLRPQGQSPTVNLANPFPQGHTTFAYEPTGSLPQSFQTDYAAFPAYGSLTAGQIAVVGSINFPAAFLNVIGRTVQLSGKITTGSVNTATLPTLNVRLDWVGGTTAGAGVNTCAFEGVAVGATKTYEAPFVCTLTTNAVGATAIGTVQPGGYMALQAQDISANGLFYADSNASTVGSLGLFAQVTANVLYTSTTNTTAAPNLLDLHVKVLQ